MSKNEKVCELCKWSGMLEAKCAVCEGNDKFEPLVSPQELATLLAYQVKDSSGNISIFKAAVLKWGQEPQLNMIIEECVELAIACIAYVYQEPEESEGFNDFTYQDMTRSLLTFVKQALKEARKNKFSLNAMSFNMDNLMGLMQSMMTGEIKRITNKKDVRDGLIEELADVEIMVGQARHGMGLGPEIDKIKRSKIDRIQVRLHG